MKVVGANSAHCLTCGYWVGQWVDRFVCELEIDSEYGYVYALFKESFLDWYVAPPFILK